LGGSWFEASPGQKNNKNNLQDPSRVWWHAPVIPTTHRKPKQQDQVPGPAGQKSEAISKITRGKDGVWGVWGCVAQAVKRLPSKWEALKD
jgi:hypothetical protein